jgi:phosphogluconate dehydratase
MTPMPSSQFPLSQFKRFSAAFNYGKLDKELIRDVAVVVRFQGLQANGMPELQEMTPAWAVMQVRVYHVALVTDGRIRQCAGSVHFRSASSGLKPLAKIQDGNLIRPDAASGRPDILIDEKILAERPNAEFVGGRNVSSGLGRGHSLDLENI